MASVATQEQAFDASAYDLPIPRDRFGRKADKLVVQLGQVVLDRTSEDDLATFEALEKGAVVDLHVRAFVAEASERSKQTEDGEDEVEIKRVLHVLEIGR
jgi:hypothetical protein